MGAGHHHDHTHGANKKTLVISFIIITVFMIVEVIGGILTNSLALLADAGHMLSDSISLLIALIAFILGERAANHAKTYGYKRFEILAAILNGVTLLAVSLFIFYEAIQRLVDPPEVASTGMLVIASIGLAVNILVAFTMLRGGDTKDNLNMRAAFLHVLGDLLGSVGAIAAALLMIFFHWTWADTAASVLVAMLILISGWRVTKDSVHILMEGAPLNVDLNDVVKTIERIEGIRGIHDLHVWSITSGQNALSCHIIVDGNMMVEESQALLRAVEEELREKEIGHVTIQVETDTHPHKDSILCHAEYDIDAGHGHSH
ncbi:cation diffusion facilitator family transporter [Oceanobacillus jeddahense]|uniref:Cation diffusion facilitator family transporter n=1 Tax=Oceanobacillus jeddahense TaxID=1462527 RepID=A0ABY5K117_9BACI|nr:cation diffusion facilitator family transporter [Oceanobacillus jeddahense]UUI04464.1 cation diffusion facilitator family transporter [Oceanobacillus jeddahense]